jgi:ribosomal protein S18 acetylase RimI-like enzyme
MISILSVMNISRDIAVRTRFAEEHDVARLVQIINLAYGRIDQNEPEEHIRAWTTESHLVTGLRITFNELRELIALDPQRSVVFVAEIGLTTNNEWEVVGCVQLEKANDGAHLGMFAVDPSFQALKIGRLLMKIAETHAWNIFKSECIILQVISVRSEMLAYYERRGYIDTNENELFTPDNGNSPIGWKPLYLRILKKYHPTGESNDV